MWQVIGHHKAVDLLQRSLKKERLAHAYLFVGPPHIGKTTLAINLAQALNCEQEQKPCGQCSACLRIHAGKHPDVQTVKRLSSTNQRSGEATVRKDISIEQIRALQQAAALQPYEGQRRVFIIDSAEYLNEESANCLLKTLEEPPAYVLIILLALNDEALLPTIASRCQRIDLYPLPAPVIEQALIERWHVTPDRARLLSVLCRGNIGWAISTLDKDSTLEKRAQELGELRSLAGATLVQQFSYASKLASKFSSDRDLVKERLSLWLDWWRDLMLVRTNCFHLVTNIDQEEALRQEAMSYSLAEITGFIAAIRASMRQLALNANPGLVLEVLMLGLPAREPAYQKSTVRRGQDE